jgi:hypothetical protein
MFAFMRRVAASVVLFVGVASAACAGDIDREAAQWALGLGGNVRIDTADKANQRFDKIEKLSAEAFKLVEIQLAGKDVRDNDLSRLVELQHLRKLNLGKTKITNEGLERLARIESLEQLYVDQTRLSDEGLAQLVALRNLRLLDLQGVPITDAGLAHVAKLTWLKELTASDADITDAGVRSLAPLKDLEKLNLASADLTDAGVAALAQFQELMSINLSRVLMTDVGLLQLGRRLKLKDLKITTTLVSGVGVKSFAELQPQCKVSWDVNDIVSKQGDDGTLLDRRWLALDDELTVELQPGVQVWRFDRTMATAGDSARPVVPWALDDSAAVEPTASLSPWKYDPRHSTVAAGYLKIERAGTYTFAISATGAVGGTLWLGTMPVVATTDGKPTSVELYLPVGYLPLAVAGYAGGDGTAHVQWKPLDNLRLMAIPETLLVHLPLPPSSPGESSDEAAVRKPLTKLPLPLPRAVAWPAAVRIETPRIITPVAVEGLSQKSPPDFLRGATALACPLRHAETLVENGRMRLDVDRDTSLFLAVLYDDTTNARTQPWAVERQSPHTMWLDGWVYVGRFPMSDPAAGMHYLYWRPCKQGEHFELRLRKYRLPIVIVPTDPSVDPRDAVPLADARASEAAEVTAAKTRYLLQQHRFDELESLAKELRMRRPRLKDGASVLEKFYDGLLPIGTTDEQWQRQQENLDRWLEAKPESIAAHVALGNFWEKFAWKARGGGYAGSVTADGAKKFAERVDVAQYLVEKARNVKQKDTGLCDLELQLAIDTGGAKEDVERIVREALAIDPANRSTLIDAARYYFPRWYGTPAELKEYALRAHELSKKEWRAIVYGQIVGNICQYHGAKAIDDFDLSWDLTRQGLTEFADFYPEAVLATAQLGRLACERGDRETARAAFQRLAPSRMRMWSSPNHNAVWKHWTQDDYLDGDQLAAFQTGRREATQVLWSPDASKLLVFSADETLTIWDAQSHALQKKSTTADMNRFAMFVPDTTMLVTADFRGEIYTHDLATGRESPYGHKKYIWALALSPDGELLASTSADKQIRFWDVESSAPRDVWTDVNDEPTALAFIDRGKTLLVGSSTARLTFWDVENKTKTGQLPKFSSGIRGITVSDDGTLMAVRTPLELSLWRWKDKKKLGTLDLPRRTINQIVFSKDGARLAAATGSMLPGVPGDVVVWDTSRLERLHTYHGHKAMVRSVCFAPDGKTLASSSDDMTVRLWKVE